MGTISQARIYYTHSTEYKARIYNHSNKTPKASQAQSNKQKKYHRIKADTRQHLNNTTLTSQAPPTVIYTQSPRKRKGGDFPERASSTLRPPLESLRRGHWARASRLHVSYTRPFGQGYSGKMYGLSGAFSCGRGGRKMAGAPSHERGLGTAPTRRSSSTELTHRTQPHSEKPPNSTRLREEVNSRTNRTELVKRTALKTAQD